MTGGNRGASEEVTKDTEEVEKLNLTEWAHQNHLKRPATMLLTKEECTSKEALAVLTAGDVINVYGSPPRAEEAPASRHPKARKDRACHRDPASNGTSARHQQRQRRSSRKPGPHGEAAPLPTTTDAALLAGDTAGEAGATSGQGPRQAGPTHAPITIWECILMQFSDQ